MPLWKNPFNRTPAQPEPEPVSEGDLLADAPDSEPERLVAAVRETLAEILKLFPNDPHVVAEALIPSGDGSQLITEEIEPVTSSSLDVRIREGASFCWDAFANQRPIVHEVIAPQSAATLATDAPPVLTRRITSRSALNYPIIRTGKRLGVLNLETSQPGTFNAQAVASLEGSGLLGKLAQELGKITLETITDEQVAKRLTDRMRARIPYIISPDDMAESNYQILSVAVSVVRPKAASAGLILTYDKSQKLTSTASDGTLYAVRASRFGRFNSDLEWELKGQSIARRIIKNKRGEFLPDAQADIDYRPSGTNQGRTGELIAPLMENQGGKVDGVIGLVTPFADNFAGDTDVAHVQAVASIAVYAIRRSEEYKLGRRRALQQERARELQNLLSPLFPEDMRTLTGERIQAVRKDVAEQLLRWAAQHTNSEYGAFVLIQTTPGPTGDKTELVMADTYNNGELYPNRRKRWLPGDGVTGRAFQQKVTINEPDVTSVVPIGPGREGDQGKENAPGSYIDYFADAKSEVAAPLKIGDTVLGVLDVESDELNHFTSDYVDWIEFLARQAAFALSTIDRAAKTYVELAMSDLSRTVEQGIADMRAETSKTGDKLPRDRIEIIQGYRGRLIKQIVDKMQDLTGAWVGRFLIELNVYKSDDSIDIKHGRLYYMYSTDANETRDLDKRFFPLGKGASSNALTKNKHYVFNDRTSLPEGYFDSDPKRHAGTKSGIFVPTLEGTHVSGVLNIECEDEGVFTPELMRACDYAGDLISQLLTGSRLRVQSILREMLRKFELDIAQEQSSNLTRFMDHALRDAAQLSIPYEDWAGWGTIIQLQPTFAESELSHQANGESQHTRYIEREYWKDFGRKDSPAISMEKEHPTIKYRLYLDVIEYQEPRVVLDRHQQDESEREGDKWPEAARAVIAVPLLSPSPSGKGKDVVGILALASPTPADFSEYDKDSQSMFVESIVSGLRTIALKQARQQLVEQLRRYLGNAIWLSDEQLDKANEAFEHASNPIDTEQALALIAIARETLPQSQKLTRLAANLSSWFLDLSDDELAPESSTADPQQGRVILEDFQTSADAFVSLVVDELSIEWIMPDAHSLPLASSPVVARLIQAALFQYLDTALAVPRNRSIQIGAQASGSYAVFWVKCGGEPLTLLQADALFKLNPVSAGRSSTRRSTSQAIQATFQVKQIAQRLHGDAYYHKGDNATLANSFYLAVPLAAPGGMR